MKIGFGTAAIGRPHYINIRSKPNDFGSIADFHSNGIAILDHAYQLGMRYFDTAPGYGIAEQLIIDWLNSKEYSDVEIATKWGYTYLANFAKDAPKHEEKEHSLSKLNEQWARSKKLLPNLSTYQIHSVTLDTGVLNNQNVLARLAELKQEHNLKIAITTTGAQQAEVIKRALEIEIDNEALFGAFQLTYNVLDQSLREVLALLKLQNRRVIIKEALANGRVFRNQNYPKYAKLYGLLEKLASKYGVGVDAIALRFCLDSVDPFVVLSGAAERAQLEQNVLSETFELEDRDLEQLYEFAIPADSYWDERKLLGWN